MYIIVGLGNPGEEYAGTRHNTGRMVADFAAEKISGIKVLVPDTFMNKTGSAIVKVVKSKKAAQKLIVVYDDLDLPLGTLKISYNRSSGGHRGVESIIKALKTREFIRIRVGIAPTTPSGKLKKPSGEEAVNKFILNEFKKPEMEVLKKTFKKATEAIQTIVGEGLEVAMNRFN
ncbi:MAG: aminoacyl-tRNA hydrolase [bacterium]|nr:aminoacyl-tRNA hydrolase [bacterium]